MPALIKRVQFLRPIFISSNAPVYAVEARYDFDFTGVTSAPSAAPTTGSVWGTGLWDLAEWGGGYTVSLPPMGAAGMGRHVAVAMRGRSNSETLHVGTDVLLDMGGLL
jgi:hypothetical protein